MILEDWVAFPVGNKYGLFTAGFIEGNMGNVNSKKGNISGIDNILVNMGNVNSKKGNISGIDNILVVFDAGENRTPGVYENPEKTKSFPMFVNWIDGKLTNSLKTTSLLLLFISHFHADHVNLIPAVIKEWVQRVNVKNSRMLIVFPSGNFMEGSLWVAKEHVARANYARVLIDAIASMGGDEDNSFDGESASNLLEIVRFIYGDNSVLIRWLENLDIDIDESDVDSMLNNIYRIIVPSIPKRGFNYEGFYDLIIPETPNDGFRHNGRFRLNGGENEGREGSEFGGLSISCDYCISLKESNLSNWFMHWNIGVSDIAVKNTYVLLHKYEVLPNKYKWNSPPIPGIGVYADCSGKTELIHVFMPYFADDFHRDYYGCEDQIERIIKNGAWRNGFGKDVFDGVRKCVAEKIGSGRLNESSMVLFHSPSNTVKTIFPWWYLDWCIEWCCCEWCWDACLLSGSHTLHLPFLSDARWYLMTGDQYMDKVVDIFDNRWKREKGKLSGHFNNEDFAWIQVPHHGSEGNWVKGNANNKWFALTKNKNRRYERYFISGTTGSNVFSTIKDLIRNKKCVFWLR